jgi:hypothetical protein
MVQVLAEDQHKRVAAIRRGIGFHLRRFYDEELKEPMPPQIVELLRDFDRRLNAKI